MEDDDDSVGSAAFGIECSATSFSEPGGALRAQPPRHVSLELDDYEGDLFEDSGGATTDDSDNDSDDDFAVEESDEEEDDDARAAHADVDANGKLVPTTVKSTSRFWGVYWKADRSKWRSQYRDDSMPSKKVEVGYYSDDEVAAFFYNEAVTAAGLDHIRPMNRVDATGRPLPRD